MKGKNEEVSYGIIGGADGPTSIFVSDKVNGTVKMTIKNGRIKVVHDERITKRILMFFRRRKILGMGIVLTIIVGVLMFTILQPTPEWKTNARQLHKSFDIISGNKARIDNFLGFTHFQWNTLYSFAPYTPEQTIYNVVGYKWDNISSTVSEGMNQVVFLKDGKVVCYIDGYPDKYKVYFNFGQYDGSYFKLTASDKLAFDMWVTDKGIRMFEYIK